MAKVRGRERTAVSVYAKNSGTYKTAAAEAEKDNLKQACSSLTLSADARVTKKKKSTESNPGGRIDAKDQRPET